MSSSTPLSSRVLHGDTLRCILAYIRTHAELNVLHRVSHTLAIESSKIHLWPSHLRVIQPREKHFLARFTSPPSIQLALNHVHQLDLRYVTCPRVEYLLHFTHIQILRLNVQAMENRTRYSRHIQIFLSKCGSTIKELHVDVDGRYDLAPLCRHMPILEVIHLHASFPQVNRDWYQQGRDDDDRDAEGDKKILKCIGSLTSQVAPQLRQVHITFTAKQAYSRSRNPPPFEKALLRTKEQLKKILQNEHKAAIASGGKHRPLVEIDIVIVDE